MHNDGNHFDEFQIKSLTEGNIDLTISDDLHEHADQRIILELHSMISFNSIDFTEKKIFIPGCGTASEAIPFAKKGATIYGHDLSEVQIEIAKKRALVNNCEKLCHFFKADALSTSYPDNYFDFIIAHAVIHHFDYSIASKEFFRILKPGGIMVFSEPFGENPILSFIREYIPYPYKHRTPDEHPLKYSDIKNFTQGFSEITIKEIQFLSMIERFIGKKPIIKTLDSIDSVLLKQFPILKRFCRAVILKAVKPS